jgi:hypothetical protein
MKIRIPLLLVVGALLVLAAWFVQSRRHGSGEMLDGERALVSDLPEKDLKVLQKGWSLGGRRRA